MFTGIIQELGTIKHITKNNNSMQITINSTVVISNVNLGDSIAVNGTCLTVTNFNKNSFCVDVMPETFVTTSLKDCKESSLVNLEPALMLTSKLGGHFVSGHIDGVGKIIAKKSQANAIYYDIQVQDAQMLKFCIYHGSIAVDGVSLTIFGADNNIITISLIPHTVKNTVLGFKVIGDIVNLEFDMLAKFTARLIEFKSESSPVTDRLNATFLEQHGFI